MLKICFVGASTVEGMGDEAGLGGWAGRISRRNQETHVAYNLGVRGQTLDQIKSRASYECKSRLPLDGSGLIVVSPGINDLALHEDGSERSNLSEIANLFRQLLKYLSAIGSTFVVGPAPVDEAKMPFASAAAGTKLDFRNDRILEGDMLYQKASADLAVPYLSVCNRLKESASYMDGLSKSDGIHPDSKGYDMQSDFVMANRYFSEFLHRNSFIS